MSLYFFAFYICLRQSHVAEALFNTCLKSRTVAASVAVDRRAIGPLYASIGLLVFTLHIGGGNVEGTDPMAPNPGGLSVGIFSSSTFFAVLHLQWWGDRLRCFDMHIWSLVKEVTDGSGPSRACKGIFSSSDGELLESHSSLCAFGRFWMRESIQLQV